MTCRRDDAGDDAVIVSDIDDELSARPSSRRDGSYNGQCSSAVVEATHLGYSGNTQLLHCVHDDDVKARNRSPQPTSARLLIARRVVDND